MPLGRIGRPDDVAGLTLFLASRAGAYVTGTVIPLDGGITRLQLAGPLDIGSLRLGKSADTGDACASGRLGEVTVSCLHDDV